MTSPRSDLEALWYEQAVVWLWCFCTSRSTFYAIDESRGHAALEKFFAEDFIGTLVTDFWRAYDAVEARMHQKCWAHLLRELKAVDERPNGPRDDWLDFAKKLRRIYIYTDAVKLAAAGEAAHSRTPEGPHPIRYLRRNLFATGRASTLTTASMPQ